MAEGQSSQQMTVGVAWYHEQEWEELRRLAADPEKLEETFTEWKAAYEDGVLKLAAAGLQPERVELTVAQLQAWCAANKCPLDAEARSGLAAELLRQRHQNRVSSLGPEFFRK
jgi:hypothetical protein